MNSYCLLNRSFNCLMSLYDGEGVELVKDLIGCLSFCILIKDLKTGGLALALERNLLF